MELHNPPTTKNHDVVFERVLSCETKKPLLGTCGGVVVIDQRLRLSVRTIDLIHPAFAAVGGWVCQPQLMGLPLSGVKLRHPLATGQLPHKRRRYCET